MKCLVDTNVLLRWSDKGSYQHAECAAAIEYLRQSIETYVCAQVLIEYYVVASRPLDVNGLGLARIIHHPRVSMPGARLWRS